MRNFSHRSARIGGMENALARPKLVGRLNRRWDLPVSSVVAGAGYGKSTILIAALGASEDRTHDRFMSLRLVTAAEELVAALAECWEFGTPPSTLGEAVDWLASSWWALSPNSVCTTIDNVQHLDGPARLLLAKLVGELKPNTHLVLAGRSHIVETAPVLLDENALRFDDDEVALLSNKTGTPVAELATVRGWPAAVAVTIAALGLSATQTNGLPPTALHVTGTQVSRSLAVEQADEQGADATLGNAAFGITAPDSQTPDSTMGGAPVDLMPDSIWSAILSPLDPEQRSGVALLALAGPCDERTLERLLGEQADDLVDGILSQVPLCVWRRGFMDVHALWAVPALASLSPVERRAVPERVVRALLDVGRASEAFVLATEYGLTNERLHIVRSVCADERLIPDAATAARWASAIGDTNCTFETDLLRGIFLKGREPRLAVDHLWRAADAARTQNFPRIEMMALALLGTVGYTLQDDTVRQHIAQRARELASDGHNSAVVLVDLGDVFRFLETGEPRLALDKLDEVHVRTADQFSSLAVYLRALALCEVGQAQAALEQLAAHEGELRPYQFGAAVVAARCRWMVGDLDGAQALLEREAAAARVDKRADHAATFDSFHRLMAVVTGRLISNASIAPTTPITMLLLASAATLPLVEEDPTKFEEVLRLANTFGGRGAVLPELRHVAWFVAPDFFQPELEGPVEAARRVGRAISSDELPASADVERSLHLFPRPLVVRLTLLWLRQMASTATSTAGTDSGVRPTWASLLQPTDRAAIRSKAFELALDVPSWLIDPEHAVEIRMLGPISITVAGVDQPPELRRERVRALLWLLVFRTEVSRREAASLLWPQLSAEASANNLRTTLGYLVKVFEADVKRTDAKSGQSKSVVSKSRHTAKTGCSILAVDRSTISLRRDVSVTVDAWELQRNLDAARQAERNGSIAHALQFYRAAADLWRADPGIDFDTDDWSNRAIGELRGAFVESAVRAAELLIGFDDVEALRLAVRALTVDRWSVRASDVEVRANSGLGRDAAARQALIRHRTLLAELGVDANRSESLAGIVSRATLGRR